MRTVEKRCEISSAILPWVSSAKSVEDLALGSGIERGRGFVEDQQLRVAQIGPGQGDLLPLSAGEIHAAFKAPSEHLPITQRKPRDDLGRHAFSGCCRYARKVAAVVDFPHGNVFSGGHFIAHEILENDPDFTVQVLQVVFPKVNSIQQNPARAGIVKTSNQLHDGRLSLTVFPHQRNSFARVAGEN